MTIIPSGHAEIDEQHRILEAITRELGEICQKNSKLGTRACRDCSPSTEKRCRSMLREQTFDYAVFLDGHLAYEEKLMELLPDTQECREHIVGHKASHEGISRKLQGFIDRVEVDLPGSVLGELMSALQAWLVEHNETQDYKLAEHLDIAAPENGFDQMLVSMLDQFVFPNRPKKTKHALQFASEFRNQKQDIHSRFDLLTPAQKRVFWLAAAGKSGPTMAGELNVSINTVKTHRAMIFQKLQIKSVVELIQLAEFLR